MDPQRKCKTYEAQELYLELTRLKPDITQYQMEADSGLSRATIQRIASGKRISRSSYRFFADYVAQYRPAIWPQSPAMDAVRARYQWFEKQPTEVFRQWLDGIEVLLLSSRNLDGEPTFDTVFALWLLAWIAHDRAYTLRQNMVENFSRSMARYDQAVRHLQALVKESSGREYEQQLLARLKVARFVTYFNGHPKESRSQDLAVIDWLKQSDVIASLKRLGDAAPHDWSGHRNGLIVSSVLKDKAACKLFYNRLTKADERFTDLCYAPNNGKAPSINDDPDCRFFLAIRKKARTGASRIRHQHPEKTR